MKPRTIVIYAALLLAVTCRGSYAALAYKPNEALEGAKLETYKTVGDLALHVNVFYPKDHHPGDKRAAIVFFFGGGWVSGSPSQFLHQCQHFASEGMVAMTCDYRVSSRNHTTPIDAVADAKSAIRWARANATRLGIDPNKIVASGGSAGGHLAACCGVIDGLDESTEDSSVSSKPNAMILFNPALNLGPDGFANKALISRGLEISPLQHVKPGQPPTIVFHGKSDTTVPYKQATEFGAAMTKAGNRCEIMGYEGQKHGFFNYHEPNGGELYAKVIADADHFLQSLGYINEVTPATQAATANKGN
jgi:acetyl esterase/lipase